MNAEQRRSEILTCLTQAKEAVSATSLAKLFSVSRQIIVGDVAILRAAGSDIAATPRGYILQSDRKMSGVTHMIACFHDGAQMEEELNICVDHGCTVVDVVVEHPVYGQLEGMLDLSTRYDVSQFVKKVKEQSAHALSELTDGIHLHTLKCPDDEAFERVKEALREAGLLYR
ncbi:MAG: transcription repressor NadR [Lachnospiraceae bacterium]|nr:transcription repressor NadR [Lachnospiraceae bacterium]